MLCRSCVGFPPGRARFRPLDLSPSGWIGRYTSRTRAAHGQRLAGEGGRLWEEAGAVGLGLRSGDGQAIQSDEYCPVL